MKKTFTVTIDGPGLFLGAVAIVGSVIALNHTMEQQRMIDGMTSELDKIRKSNNLMTPNK